MLLLSTMKREREEDFISVGRSIDFLGYEFSIGNQKLRKSIKKNFARKMNVKSRRRRHEVMCSYWGWCKYGRCKNLWNKITNKDMGFKDKGIVVKNVDREGKEFFDVKLLKIIEILNEPIMVLSFVPNIETKGTDGVVYHDRYVVLFKGYIGERKFITNSREMKDVLDQSAEKERKGISVFPVDNVAVKRKDLGGGKFTYIFVDL